MRARVYTFGPSGATMTQENDMVAVPGGREGHHNKPGLSRADALQGVCSAVPCGAVQCSVVMLQFEHTPALNLDAKHIS